MPLGRVHVLRDGADAINARPRSRRLTDGTAAPTGTDVATKSAGARCTLLPVSVLFRITNLEVVRSPVS
jgi:hypothetical protein